MNIKNWPLSRQEEHKQVVEANRPKTLQVPKEEPYMLGRYAPKKRVSIASKPALTILYNRKLKIISLIGKNIQIPPSTNQSIICDVVFENKDLMNKEWNWDEIFMRSGVHEDEIDNYNSMQIYSAAREINKKIAIETGIKELFIVKTKTILLNLQISK